MEIRRLSEADKPSAYYLASLAFSHGRRAMDWADDPNQADFVGYGVWENGNLHAQVVILDYRIHMGPEVVVPMGGIAGVACLPASRGRGYVRAAMLRALEHMRDAGQVVSILFPFSFDFYRQLGWEWVGVERRYSVPSNILKRADETDRCRQATTDDRPAIANLYRQFSQSYRGMLDRDERLWCRLLDDRPDYYTVTFLYEGTRGIEGYLTYSGGSGECVDISEFICTSNAARRGLLGLLRRMNMQTRRFAWSAPEDDPLWYVFCHHGVETRIAPVTQARVVDIGRALNAYRPFLETKGAFTLRVVDEQAPWNDAVWRVEFDAECVRADRASASPQVTLDIRSFTQLYMGSANAYTIAENGDMELQDDKILEPLATFFAGPCMWMNDHF